MRTESLAVGQTNLISSRPLYECQWGSEPSSWALPIVPLHGSPPTAEFVRIPYVLRRVPPAAFGAVVPLSGLRAAGEIVLTRVEKIGKNARIELTNGRPCALHVGDLLAVVFGNRYATMQFEGYARARGEECDLLSMGGLCGVMTSKHDAVPESTKLRILGAMGGIDGHPMRLADFALSEAGFPRRPKVLVVCGTSMDAGKTHTAMSLIRGFCRHGVRVAGIKLTGTAAGRDTWNMLDAGACVALDFIDGGFPSTYQAALAELLTLERRLVAHAGAKRADWVVMEIADGLLQQETAALLKTRDFVERIDAWVFAAGDALSASAGVRILRELGIEPVALSGRLSMSPLAMREAESATRVTCLTAAELQSGGLVRALDVRHLAAEGDQSTSATCVAP